MNLFYYMRRGLAIQYNSIVAVTPVPGLKFTNWYEKKSSFFFWHIILVSGLFVALAVGFKFWSGYQYSSYLKVYAGLEQGAELAFPAVYLCLRRSLDPKKLAKYRNDFLQPNLTMSVEAIDSDLQHMYRFQRSAFNISKRISDSLKQNINMDWLDENINKLYYTVDDQLNDCSFQGLHKKCKDLFEPMETALGYCFVFNSIYTDKNLHEDPHHVWYINIFESDEDWSLRFSISRQSATLAMIYFKHPKYLLALNDVQQHIWFPMKQLSSYTFSATKSIYEDMFRTLALSYRLCNFPDDTFLDPELRAEFNGNFYDVGVCFNHCHAKKFMELCRCLPSFTKHIFPKMANTSRICGFQDMECYENNYLAIRKMKCSECLRNCDGAFYLSYSNEHDVEESDRYLRDSSLEVDYLQIDIQLIYWPLLYYRFINIFSTTEFILALASTSCLFLGTSILTLMEVFYNFFIRLPLLYFVNWEYFIKTVRKQEELERKQVLPCINMKLKPSLRQN